MVTKISNEEEYTRVMARILIPMKKGEANTTVEEEKELYWPCLRRSMKEIFQPSLIHNF